MRIEGLVEPGPDDPGYAVSVFRGPHVVERCYAGLASLTHRVRVGPETRFHIVSVSKTFNAAAVLILAARGALKLDDDARRYVPELPETISRLGIVTIRHLLSMTSGLGDVLEIERLRGVWDTSPRRRRDLLDLARCQTTVSAPAGAQYMYANVNAVLIEEVIARASGMPAEAFRRATLYEPLGLQATAERPHDGLVVRDLAEPYVSDEDGGWSRAMNLLGIAADTLTTNLDDLTRWLLALRAGTIDGVETTAMMAEPARVRDGTRVYYGLGLAVRRYRGLTVLCHTGSQPGYKAHVAYVPERDVGVVILSNREDIRPAAVAAAIMDDAIGDGFPCAHPAAEARRRSKDLGISTEEMAVWQGSYVDPEAGEWVALSFEHEVLHGETLGDPIFLYHAGGRVFRDSDDYRATVPVELRFESDASCRDVTCRLTIGGQHVTLVKCERPTYHVDALAQFAGRYEGTETASRHMISVVGSALVVDYGLGADEALRFDMEPIGRDMFLVRPEGPGIAYRHVFRFERDADGCVVSAVVTMERLKGVRLRRTRPGAEGRG
jgi:CubicO group peptidase (beta-lactamase class C family)